MTLHIFVLVLCFLLLAVFSAGGRILLFYELKVEAPSHRISERILHYFQGNTSRFYATILLGSTIAILLFSYTAGAIIHNLSLEMDIKGPWVRMGVAVLSFILAANVLLLGAIYLPQRIVKRLKYRTWNLIWLPVTLVFVLLFPFTFALTNIQRSLRKNSPGIFAPWLGNPALTTQGAAGGATQAETIQEMDIDQEILQNAIEFPSLRVRDCMIPRTEITAVDINDPIEVVKQHFINSGHSRLLVYRESVDNIVGYIHLVDLFGDPRSIEKMVMPITIISEQTPASDLLKSLIEKRRTIALVVDEFGGTSGLVTIEDLMEEIIGDIEDEFDVDDSTEKKISDTEFIFSARLEIDYLNEKYGLGLPEGDYDTLGGLIFFVHQNIPKPRDIVSYLPFEFLILSTDQARINDVRLKIIK
jgi:CBS domain containing-hemolysin-like protein